MLSTGFIIFCIGSMLAVYFGIRQIIAERHILATFEITDTEPPEEDPIDEPHKRKKFPFTLSEFAGQPEITKSLTMYMDPRVLKDGVLEHILFFGMAGLGKTTLSEIVAATLEKPFIELEGNSLNNKDAIIALAKKITPGCIVFIDEIHQIKPRVSEMFYKMMENWQLSVMTDDGPELLAVPQFTVIGATTDAGQMLKPFRDRFQLHFNMKPYDRAAMISVMKSMPKPLPFDSEVERLMINIAQYTPRILIRYIKQICKIAEYYGHDIVTMPHFRGLLEATGVNVYGLTREQVRVLHSLRSGNPLGQKALAEASMISEYDLTAIIEPFLVVRGFISKTSRGRRITDDGLNMLRLSNKFDQRMKDYQNGTNNS